MAVGEVGKPYVLSLDIHAEGDLLERISTEGTEGRILVVVAAKGDGAVEVLMARTHDVIYNKILLN